MEQRNKIVSLKFDIKNIGPLFYLPIVTGLLASGYCLLRNYGYDNVEVIKNIRIGLNIFCVPFVFIWIIGLFQDLLDSEGKETLLSLPYNNLSYGILRVCRMFGLYLIYFYILFITLCIILQCLDDISLVDLFFPTISIFFYASMAFLVIVVTKSMAISYAIVSVFTIFAYLTRGAAVGPINPFYWSFPRPFLDSNYVMLVLVTISTYMLYISTIIFKKRNLLL